MTVFVTSDIHLNHRNILKYCPHRGGPEVTDELVSKMNETIISNWNSLITSDDEVYVIGDVAMGQIIHAPKLIRRLNGKKYLILGNHDKKLAKDINADPSLSDLFVWIDKYHEMSYTHNGTKYFITMSHYPMHSWNQQHQGSIMLHGHLHGTPHGIPGRIMDIGIDTNDLYPYLMDDVIHKMSQHVVRDNHHRE